MIATITKRFHQFTDVNTGETFTLTEGTEVEVEGRQGHSKKYARVTTDDGHVAMVNEDRFANLVVYRRALDLGYAAVEASS